MVEEPDVRLDGASHEQILEWVRQGRAGESTTILENWLQGITTALRQAADEVNRAIQHAGSDEWSGKTADSVHVNTTSLVHYVDEFESHGTLDRYSAMGQSGESAATRDRVPPIPLHLDAQPTILGSTVDPKARIDARRAAEEQARLVMAEYQEATRHRLSALPQIGPVPAIVLDTSTDEPGTPGTTGGRAKPAVPVPAPNGGRLATQPSTPARPAPNPSGSPGQNGDPGAVSTAPQSIGPAPVAGSEVARGDPVATESPAPTVVAGRSGAVPVGGGPGMVGGVPVGEPENTGGGEQRPGEGPKAGAVQRAVERQAVVRREVGSTRVGPNGVVGGAAGAPGQEEEEHQNRYRVPSGEPFDAEEVEYDGEFLVAPDVIGGPE